MKTNKRIRKTIESQSENTHDAINAGKFFGRDLPLGSLGNASFVFCFR